MFFIYENKIHIFNINKKKSVIKINKIFLIFFFYRNNTFLDKAKTQLLSLHNWLPSKNSNISNYIFLH